MVYVIPPSLQTLTTFSRCPRILGFKRASEDHGHGSCGTYGNRNHLIFEGTSFTCTEIVRKAAADADEWFMDQRIEEDTWLEETPAVVAVEKWRPPRQNWFMCNIAVDWAKYSLLTGGAWVLRDEKGVVLCHSRRTFGQFPS